MHILCQLLHVLCTLYIIFMPFLGLTYEQHGTMPVACFLLFLVSEKLLRKYSQNWMTKSHAPIFPDTTTETKGESDEGDQAPTPPGGVGPTPGVPPYGVGPSDLHRRCPFAHIYLFTRKP